MSLRTRVGLSLLLLLLVTVFAATLFITVDAGAAPDSPPGSTTRPSPSRGRGR